MSYMSYCRFEGTKQELARCVNDLQNFEELSEREQTYAQNLYDLCNRYMDAYEEWREQQEEWD